MDFTYITSRVAMLIKAFNITFGAFIIFPNGTIEVIEWHA